MYSLLKPIIETRLEEAESSVGTRKWAAELICNYLGSNHGINHICCPERTMFYDACECLLGKEDSERILLYFPLGLLTDAPDSFREAFTLAWYDLLYSRDVRENFHLGDCFEYDARPIGGLIRVVKCAHLTPWLLAYGYIDVQQLVDVVESFRFDDIPDDTALYSFRDTWNYIRAQGILSDTQLRPLVDLTAHLPERTKQEPLYNSESRQKWLKEKDRPVKLLTPDARLEGPFSANLPALKERIEEIAASLSPTDIVLIGGSSLQGYGAVDSDTDVWKLTDLEDSDSYPGSFHASHIYFDSVWLGGDAVNEEELKQIARWIINKYTGGSYAIQESDRRHAIRRIESGLLQYRLLHKGFARFTGRRNYFVPDEMDGDCPFYDDEYRRIATMLYAKYVWL